MADKRLAAAVRTIMTALNCQNRKSFHVLVFFLCLRCVLFIGIDWTISAFNREHNSEQL